MKTKLVVALVVGLAAGVAGAAQGQAQGRSHFGPQIGYNFDYEALLIGAQFGAPIGRHLEFYPSFNYYAMDVGTVWAINVDVKYRVPIENADWLYVAGGLNITNASFGSVSNTNAGINLVGGIESRQGNIHPFGEVRLSVGDGSSVQIAGGLNFTLGRH